ncbi:MAG: hypothetical protein D5S03_11145 [Desulfonatronospira sp. MSAO_Bac3]|nr:MAG: hypothetical protein D5S03_11145 [Desulfonatronospira sp. MSAO_Bac3]
MQPFILEVTLPFPGNIITFAPCDSQTISRAWDSPLEPYESVVSGGFSRGHASACQVSRNYKWTEVEKLFMKTDLVPAVFWLQVVRN